MNDEQKKKLLEQTTKEIEADFAELSRVPGFADLAEVMGQVEETARLTAQYLGFYQPPKTIITSNSTAVVDT